MTESLSPDFYCPFILLLLFFLVVRPKTNEEEGEEEDKNNIYRHTQNTEPMIDTFLLTISTHTHTHTIDPSRQRCHGNGRLFTVRYIIRSVYNVALQKKAICYNYQLA